MTAALDPELGGAREPLTEPFRTPQARHSPGVSIVRGALALLGTQPLTWVTSLAAAIVVPHYLGARELGTFAVAGTVVGFIRIVAALGVPDYLVRSVATAPERTPETLAGAVTLVAGVTTLVALLTGLVLWYLHIPAGHVALMEVFLANTIVLSCLALMTSVLQGQERHIAYAWCLAGGSVAGTWLGLAWLHAGGGVTGYVAVTAVPGVLTLGVTARLARFRLSRASVDFGMMRRLALGGRGFLGWNVMMMVRGYVDVLLVAALVSTQAAGWLAAAYRIIAFPVFIPTLVMTPLYPVLSRCVNEPAVFRRTLRRSVLAVLVLTVPASAGICALAPAVPNLLHWPRDFEHSVSLMVVLAWQQPLVAVDMVLGTALFALHKERRFLVVLLCAAIFNPLANVVGIPIAAHLSGDGTVAAAGAELLTELLMFVGAVILLPRGMLGRETLVVTAKVAIASVAVLVPAALLRDQSLPLAVVAGGVGYAGAALGVGIVRPAELGSLYRVARRTVGQRVARASA